MSIRNASAHCADGFLFVALGQQVACLAFASTWRNLRHLCGNSESPEASLCVTMPKTNEQCLVNITRRICDLDISNFRMYMCTYIPMQINFHLHCIQHHPNQSIGELVSCTTRSSTDRLAAQPASARLPRRHASCHSRHLTFSNISELGHVP